MDPLAVSLIALGCIFNCCAVGYLLLQKRQRDLQTKRFRKNLEEIKYHLARARAVEYRPIDTTGYERDGKSRCSTN